MNTKALVVIFAALALSYVLTAVAQDYRGFGDQYVVQVGDLNGDGLKDLHLQYRPRVALINLDDISVPIVAHSSPVGDFVLQHTASGGFAVVSNLTAAQKAAVASWPVATGVKALVHD